MPKISELDSPSTAALKAKAGTTSLPSDLAGKAPIAPAFVVVGAADGTLPNERRLVAGANVTITDGGPGGTIEIASTGGGGGGGTAVGTTITDAGGYYTGGNVEAALQEAGAAILAQGTSLTGKAPLAPAYMVVGANDATLPNERRLVAGAGIAITDGGPGGTIEIASTGGGGGGAGTVTSVGLSVGTGLSLTGATPITGSGSWALALSPNLQSWSSVAPAAKVDVSALAAATGDGLVGYRQAGTGTVARLLSALIDDGPLYAKDFGATGNGTTDDTTALQAAITAAMTQQRELVLHAGVFKVTAPLNAVGILRMRGQGSGSFAYGSLAAVDTTVIRMVNASNQTHVLKLENSNTGGNLQALQIDANDDASVGLDIKSVLRATFTDIYVRRPLTHGVRLWCNDNVNTMFNTFTNLQIYNSAATSIGLYLSGALPNQALANTCHNVFINTKIDYAGLNSEGLRVGNSDNNLFYQTFISSPNSTEGSGVTLVNEYGSFPISTGFFHLQAGPKGMYVATNANDNYVYGYATDNAQPDPNWNPATTRFFWTDNAGRISNVRSLREVSLESGFALRLNGYLTGNTYMTGNTSAMSLYVNGVLQANVGVSSFAVTQAASFASHVDVASGNRIKLQGAANLTGLRYSSPNVEINVGASVAASFGTNTLGFCGTAPITRPNLTGSKASGAALASMIAAGAAMGLWTDGTSA